MKVTPAAAADVICVVAFAVIGRSSHAEAESLGGVLQTAWPFLAGWLVGLLLSRAWRGPGSLRTGVVIWVSTVVGGIALRLLSGSTAQWAFVIVATIFLGVLLIGWRALLRLVQRSHTRRQERAPI